MTNTTTTILDSMLECTRAGISVIPIDHRTKRPARALLPVDDSGKATWKPCQQEIADEATIRRWADAGIQAFAVVGGGVSGGLLIIDFDAPGFCARWADEVGELAYGLPIQKTGGGGEQIVLRCPNPGGNDKLAWTPDPAEETGRTIAIETRGEGGYAVVGPSLHPSGNPYEWLPGVALADVPTLSQAHADALLAAARKLDEAPHTRQELEAQARQDHQRRAYASRNGTASVIDAFNRAHAIEAILEQAGYTAGTRGRYVRPGGKSESVSVKDGRSCHWSSNDPLNDGRGNGGCGCCDAFDVYTRLEHNGDVKAAVRAAAKAMGMKMNKPAAPGFDCPDDAEPGAVLVCLADVERKKIDWLWQNKIPLGRLTLLVGRPGEGKSLFTTDAASRVSTGSPWPDGTACPRGGVIFVTAEDDAGDTIGPRLDAHHADCRRIHQLAAVRRMNPESKKLEEVLFTLADVVALEQALQKIPDPRLIIIDPIGSFLGGGTDAHRDNEVRSVLAPVGRLAERYGAAVLVVAHRRKSRGSVADDLALGSRAFTGIARAVWHLTRDKDDKNRRLLLPGKNNLAPEGKGMAFTIGGEPASLRWERDPVDMNANDALAAENDDPKPGPEPEARNAAAEWLQGMLDDGKAFFMAVEVQQIKAAAKAAGLAWRTVQRAADDLGVKREKSTFTSGWTWRLPRCHAGRATKMPSAT